MDNFKDFAEQYAEAWSAHDTEMILSFFTEDCLYEDVALSSVNTGKQQSGGVSADHVRCNS